MIEFFKNESGMRLEVEELAQLMEMNVLDEVVDIILALDQGMISQEDIDTSKVLRFIINTEEDKKR